MKLKDILAIQSVVEGRLNTIDILESGYTYYSKSKDEYIDLLDLHITHFIRIFLKQVEEYHPKSAMGTNGVIDDMQDTLKQMHEDLQKLKKDME